MRTVDKVFDILEFFLNGKRDVGIAELAKSTGVNVTTAHRIAAMLIQRGYLTQPDKRGNYSLGMKLLQYGEIINKESIGNMARPFMKKLNAQIGESVNLAIMDSSQVVYIEHLESKHILRTFTEVGNRAPLYCTGVGKLFLAYMSPKQLKEYLKNNKLRAYTKYTIIDPEKLNRELVVIRKHGIAMDNGEMEVGIRCMAVPIRDSAENVVGAISISGPTARMDNSSVTKFEPLLKECGLGISQSVGYRLN